jgi:CspA family cold shock protein
MVWLARDEKVCEMARGTVKWFDSKKGFGFITHDGGGPDVFVDYTEVEGEGFRSLVEGQRVEFEIRRAKTGPEAKGVRVLRG